MTTSQEGNLFRELPQEVLEAWPGCWDQDCLHKCDTLKGHCERLARFMKSLGEKK